MFGGIFLKQECDWLKRVRRPRVFWLRFRGAKYSLLHWIATLYVSSSQRRCPYKCISTFSIRLSTYPKLFIKRSPCKYVVKTTACQTSFVFRPSNQPNTDFLFLVHIFQTCAVPCFRMAFSLTLGHRVMQIGRTLYPGTGKTVILLLNGLQNESFVALPRHLYHQSYSRFIAFERGVGYIAYLSCWTVVFLDKLRMSA